MKTTSKLLSNDFLNQAYGISSLSSLKENMLPYTQIQKNYATKVKAILISNLNTLYQPWCSNIRNMQLYFLIHKLRNLALY